MQGPVFANPSPLKLHRSLREKVNAAGQLKFGAKWRDDMRTHAQSRFQSGRIRPLYASVNELICLSNMENLNALFIADGLPQPERLRRLNKIAIEQMHILSQADGRKLLK